jgi:thioredoxin
MGNTRTVKSIAILAVMALLFLNTCGGKQHDRGKPAGSGSAVIEITSTEEFSAIIDTSGERLLGFDLYANWCGPCRMLAPILEKIAQENTARITFFRIDVDKFPQLAKAFKVSGIPTVAFVRNKRVLSGLVGLQPESEYIKAIEGSFSQQPATSVPEATGRLIDGVRVISIEPGFAPADVYVYRGDSVKLIIGKADREYSLSIPAFSISTSLDAGEDAEVLFKPASAGVFRMFGNGNYPLGNDKQESRIVVMERQEHSPTQAAMITSEGAQQLIEKSKPLILDVRTPREFYAGHIPSALLMPLDQLEERVAEIRLYQKDPVLTYCRTGGRSLAATQILIRNGFTKVYNLKGGLIEWSRNGCPLESSQMASDTL